MYIYTCGFILTCQFVYQSLPCFVGICLFIQQSSISVLLLVMKLHHHDHPQLPVLCHCCLFCVVDAYLVLLSLIPCMSTLIQPLLACLINVFLCLTLSLFLRDMPSSFWCFMSCCNQAMRVFYIYNMTEKCQQCVYRISVKSMGRSKLRTLCWRGDCSSPKSCYHSRHQKESIRSAARVVGLNSSRYALSFCVCVCVFNLDICQKFLRPCIFPVSQALK